jgi:hypothetical protein
MKILFIFVGKQFCRMNNKIELVSCLRNGDECAEHRFFINRHFNDSYDYLLNKDYSRSILALKSAYNKTNELQSSPCVKCAELFRDTITKSLEYIHQDLYKMSKSFFGARRFQSSFELAKVVLSEIKNEG